MLQEQSRIRGRQLGYRRPVRAVFAPVPRDLVLAVTNQLGRTYSTGPNAKRLRLELLVLSHLLARQSELGGMPLEATTRAGESVKIDEHEIWTSVEHIAAACYIRLRMRTPPASMRRDRAFNAHYVRVDRAVKSLSSLGLINTRPITVDGRRADHLGVAISITAQQPGRTEIDLDRQKCVLHTDAISSEQRLTAHLEYSDVYVASLFDRETAVEKVDECRRDMGTHLLPDDDSATFCVVPSLTITDRRRRRWPIESLQDIMQARGISFIRDNRELHLDTRHLLFCDRQYVEPVIRQLIDELTDSYARLRGLFRATPSTRTYASGGDPGGLAPLINKVETRASRENQGTIDSLLANGPENVQKDAFTLALYLLTHGNCAYSSTKARLTRWAKRWLGADQTVFNVENTLKKALLFAFKVRIQDAEREAYETGSDEPLRKLQEWERRFMIRSYYETPWGRRRYRYKHYILNPYKVGAIRRLARRRLLAE
jgi:hypothetical protein